MKTSLQIRSQKHLEHLFSDCFWDYSEVFQEKNHFKVNVRLRPSNWHINKNLQKIKSILYQDSCWINRTPWRNHLVLQTPCKTDLETAAANTLDDWSADANTLDDWSWDCCCKHLTQLISILLLQTPCSTDLKTTVANTLLNWSQDYCYKHLAYLILKDCSNHLLLQVLNAFQNCSQACMTDPRLFWCPECCMLISSEELFLTLFLSKIIQAH